MTHKYDEFTPASFDVLCVGLDRSFEAELGETLGAVGEADMIMENLKDWMKPESVPTPLVQKPAKSYMLKDPKGVVLVRCFGKMYLLVSRRTVVVSFDCAGLFETGCNREVSMYRFDTCTAPSVVRTLKLFLISALLFLAFCC